MRISSLLAVAFFLSGCAPQPLTPEQRAALIQAYQITHAYPLVQPPPLQFAPPPRSTNCTTNWIGNTAYTNCN